MSVFQSESVKELATALAKAQGKHTQPSEWVRIPGFAGYAAHPSGLVFSTQGSKPRMLQGTASGNGYRAVQLRANDGSLMRIYIHRLIASLFIPYRQGGQQINHKDGNKRNNAASNLEWCSAAENLQHARETGLSNLSGPNNPMARLTTEQVYQIRALRQQGKPYSVIAQIVGCSIMQANRIARGLLRKDG